MKCKILFVAGILMWISFGCAPADKPAASGDETVEQETNPAAPGFNAEASDERAIQIADQVMEAMGGRKNWDDTRFIGWNFFGRRYLLWDKHEDRVRIEVPTDNTIYLVDLETGSGKVMKDGQVLENPDSLAKYAGRGKSIWINDSYWLVMPFKLKDSGVTLKYMGEDTTQAGAEADLLQLTFENVGDTPQNKYHVYVDKEDNLVKQWAFFRNAEDPEPGFITPWQNYQPYDGILLSGARGDRQLSDIRVFESVPDEAFTAFDPVQYQKME